MQHLDPDPDGRCFFEIAEYSEWVPVAAVVPSRSIGPKFYENYKIHIRLSAILSLSTPPFHFPPRLVNELPSPSQATALRP